MKKQKVAKTGSRRGTRSSAVKAGKLRNVGKPSALNLMGATAEAGRRQFALSNALEFYRPLKKPVTLRLDADVLAWFKKDGRRYQTRINSALRKVMEREMKSR